MLFNRPVILYDDNPDSSGGGSSSGNSPSAGQQLTPDQWQARVSGLQSTLDKQKATFEAQIADLTGKLQTANGRIGELTTQFGTLQNDHSAASTQLQTATQRADQLKTDLDAKTAQLTRSLFIMEKFPQLATFEAQGLLPAAANPEELQKKLEAFSAAMGAMVTQTVDQKLTGSSPNPPPAPPGGAPLDSVAGLSDDDLYNRLMAQNAGKDPEYEKMLAEWGKRFPTPKP